MKQQQSDNRLIRGAFTRMLFVNMFVMFTANTSGFIDNLVISSRLSTQALSAVGFFSPVSTAVGLFSMVVIGAQVLCGNLIGAGKKNQITSLFNTAFAFLGALYTLVAVPGILLRAPLASLLGAEGEVHAQLCDYILGCVPGIPLQALCALLMAFVSFNNDMRRSYYAAIAISGGNLLGDMLLAGYGTFCIGLATTLSYAAGFAVLLPGYLNRDKTIHLARVPMDWRLLGKAAYRGLPALMLTIGLVVKNSLMNRALLTSAGDEGIAVVNVLASACGIVGIFTGGCNAAYTSLAGLYYGEEDRGSFCSLFRTAAGIGLAGAVVLMAAIMAASPLLADLFFKSNPIALSIGRQMFLWGFTFLPLNILMNLLLYAYQAQGRMTLVNILSVAETSFIGLSALVSVPVFGVEAAWLVNAAVDLFCLMIIFISAFVWRGRIDFSMETLLKLPDSFGAGENDFREYTISSLADVCETSEAVIRFCTERGFDRCTCSFGGLCIEEMARTALELKSPGRRDIHMDIRVVVRKELIIRIRDNCTAFDPRKRLDMFSVEDPCRNIGIRLTASIARDIDYYNNAGVNTLIMALSPHYQKPMKEALA